jgi:hypothetical protein
MIHSEILKQSDPEKQQALIKQHLEQGKVRHKDMIPRYLIWREYLLRSDKYRDVCDWISSIRKTSEIPLLDPKIDHTDKHIQDYLTFAVEYEKRRTPFYIPLDRLCNSLTLSMVHGRSTHLYDYLPSVAQWAIDNGYDRSPEMLMTYFIFGDIFRDPVEPFLLRVLTILDLKEPKTVFNISDVLEFLYVMADIEAAKEYGKGHSVSQFKDAFTKILTSYDCLVTYIFKPWQNKEVLIRQLNQLLDARREVPGKSGDDIHYIEESGQFLFPSGKARVDALEKYLNIHDMKAAGATFEAIAEKLQAGSSSKFDSILRQVKRDNSFANQIIANAEKGFFPGDYS